MSDNKKQHYVPKFYLRLFSNQGNGTHLGLYQRNGQKYIPQAGLSGQAYGNFFYGQDGKLEKALSAIEGSARQMIASVIEHELIPNFGTLPYNDMLSFCLLQSFRTKAMIKQADDMINSVVKQIASHDITLKDKLEEFTVGLTEGPSFMIQTLLSTIKDALDLHAKLVVNQTSTPFITSDHPVVKYNQFLESRHHPGGWTGLFTKGLQLFYPLNDKYLLLFYDPKIYKIGSKNQHNVYINNTDDVDQINALQLINCDELLFFNHKVNESYIVKLHQKFKKYIRNQLSITREYLDKKNDDGSYSTFLHSQNENVQIKMVLTFIKQTTYAKQYKMTGYAVELRKESLRFSRE